MMDKAKCHFDLDLNLKKCPDKGRILFKTKVLQSYIRAELGPLQFAIRNLIGILYYYLGEYFQAYTSFETILQEDPVNLNAIENLARVSSKLMNTRKEAELIAFRNQIIKKGPSIAIQARFRAEHAYAIGFDVFETVHDIRRHSVSNEIFTECLAKTQNLNVVMRSERAMWMLCMIWNYKSWNNKNFSTDSSKSNNEEIYPDILKTVLDIRVLVPDNEYLQCLVWGYLGYFFWKTPMDEQYDVKKKNRMRKNAEIPEIVRTNGLIEHFFNPELCFKKSRKIREEIEAMHLYMGWLKSKGRYIDGIKLLNKCIQLNNSETNYFSYSKRGELMAQRCKQKLGRGTDLSDLLDDLHKSIGDFEFVCQVYPSAHGLGYLGTVCGIASNKGENEVLKTKALCAFQRGLNCPDGPQDQWLHFKHAVYLNEIGEYDSALDAIHRCVECRHAGINFPQDIEYLLNWHVEKMARNEDTNKLLLEMIYWFCEAFHKYDRTMVRTEFKKFLLKNIKKLSVDFYVQIFLKDDSDLNQFFVGVLREKDVLTALEDNFGASILTLILNPIACLPLKGNYSTQPTNREGCNLQ